MAAAVAVAAAVAAAAAVAVAIAVLVHLFGFNQGSLVADCGDTELLGKDEDAGILIALRVEAVGGDARGAFAEDGLPAEVGADVSTKAISFSNSATSSEDIVLVVCRQRVASISLRACAKIVSSLSAKSPAARAFVSCMGISC